MSAAHLFYKQPAVRRSGSKLITISLGRYSVKVSKCLIVVILYSLLSPLLYGQQAVHLQGYWELLSQKVNGKENQSYGRQIKLLTGTHFVWVRQNKKQAEELLAKGTLRDSLTAFHDAFGAGTYTITGTTYSETTEFFYEPKYIGTSIDFTFTLNGDRWHTTGHFVGYDNGKKTNELIEEEWKRVE
jgi:hypothetical protein